MVHDHTLLQILSIIINEGLEEPLSYPDFVRKAHIRKHGTFIDERAKALVLEVEQAVEEMIHSALTAGTTTSKRRVLNQGYIKLVQTRKGTIYGLGSVQFKKRCPSESVPATLKRSLDMEMRPQASNPPASTAQPTQAQRQSQSQAQPQGQGQAPSPAQDQSQAPGDSQPQHLQLRISHIN
ncbi:hypothetical protein IGI04_035394 [Brassica rapa subsp. trilocularis]|uniref:Uncharacterized protein n=1 Tax=Brassica rapa subsp. trilocularis TaxID=1813537 RepID=A0ABQ7LED6_BRACM|nr:hypothetical protein IGI04_035394 [Brassica rapa subsp. trilocularis]